MKKIKLKALCDDVLITLNNLRDFDVEEDEGSVSVTFKAPPDKKASDDEDGGSTRGSGE